VEVVVVMLWWLMSFSYGGVPLLSTVVDKDDGFNPCQTSPIQLGRHLRHAVWSGRNPCSAAAIADHGGAYGHRFHLGDVFMAYIVPFLPSLGQPSDQIDI
jgi:hypothetical protein